MAKPKRLAGTALLLRTLKEHRLEAAQDGVDVADGLGSESLTRHGAPTKRKTFGAAVRVNRDIMKYGCDIGAEKRIQQANAMSKVRHVFADWGKRWASGEFDEMLPADSQTQ